MNNRDEFYDYDDQQWALLVKLELEKMTPEEIYEALFEYELDYHKVFTDRKRRDRIIELMTAEKNYWITQAAEKKQQDD